MEEHKHFWKYQSYIFRRAWNRVKKSWGVVSASVGFIVLFVADLIIRLDPTRTDIRLEDVEIAFVVYGAFVVIAVIACLSYESMLDHNEQVAKIDGLKNQLTWHNADLEIREYNDQFDQKECGIWVSNKSQTQVITDFAVVLANVYRVHHEKDLGAENIVLSNRQFGEGKYFKELGKISPGDQVLVYLARIQDHVPNLWLSDERYPYECNQWSDNAWRATLEIELIINGIIEKRPMPTHIVKARIQFERTDDLGNKSQGKSSLVRSRIEIDKLVHERFRTAHVETLTESVRPLEIEI